MNNVVNLHKEKKEIDAYFICKVGKFGEDSPIMWIANLVVDSGGSNEAEFKFRSKEEDTFKTVESCLADCLKMTKKITRESETKEYKLKRKVHIEAII